MLLFIVSVIILVLSVTLNPERRKRKAAVLRSYTAPIVVEIGSWLPKVEPIDPIVILKEGSSLMRRMLRNRKRLDRRWELIHPFHGPILWIEEAETKTEKTETPRFYWAGILAMGVIKLAFIWFMLTHGSEGYAAAGFTVNPFFRGQLAKIVGKAIGDNRKIASNIATPSKTEAEEPMYTESQVNPTVSKEGAVLLVEDRPRAAMARMVEHLEISDEVWISESLKISADLQKAGYTLISEMTTNEVGFNQIWGTENAKTVLLASMKGPDFKSLFAKAVALAMKAVGKTLKYYRGMSSEATLGSFIPSEPLKVLVRNIIELEGLKVYDGAIYAILEDFQTLFPNVELEAGHPIIFRIWGVTLIKGGLVLIPRAEWPEWATDFNVITTDDAEKQFGWTGPQIVSFTSGWKHMKKSVTSSQDLASMLDLMSPKFQEILIRIISRMEAKLSKVDWNETAAEWVKRELIKFGGRGERVESIEMVDFVEARLEEGMDIRSFPTIITRLMSDFVDGSLETKRVRMDLGKYSVSSYPTVFPQMIFSKDADCDTRPVIDKEGNWLVYVGPKTYTDLYGRFNSDLSWGFRRPNSFGDGIRVRFISDETVAEGQTWVSARIEKNGTSSLSLMQDFANGGDWDDLVVFWLGELNKVAREAYVTGREVLPSNKESLRYQLRDPKSWWNEGFFSEMALDSIQYPEIEAVVFESDFFTVLNQGNETMETTKGWTGQAANLNMAASAILRGASSVEKDSLVYRMAGAVSTIMLSDIVDAETQGVVSVKAYKAMKSFMGFKNLLAAEGGEIVLPYVSRVPKQTWSAMSWPVTDAILQYRERALEILTENMSIGMMTGTSTALAELARESISNRKWAATAVQALNRMSKNSTTAKRAMNVIFLDEDDDNKVCQTYWAQMGAYNPRKRQIMKPWFKPVRQAMLSQFMDQIWGSKSSVEFRYDIAKTIMASKWAKAPGKVMWDAKGKKLVLEHSFDQLTLRSGDNGDFGIISYTNQFISDCVANGSFESIAPTLEILVYGRTDDKIYAKGQDRKDLAEKLVGMYPSLNWSVKIGRRLFKVILSNDALAGNAASIPVMDDNGKMSFTTIDLSILRNAKIIAASPIGKSGTIRCTLAIGKGGKVESYEKLEEIQAQAEIAEEPPLLKKPSGFPECEMGEMPMIDEEYIPSAEEQLEAFVPTLEIQGKPELVIEEEPAPIIKEATVQAVHFIEPSIQYRIFINDTICAVQCQVTGAIQRFDGDTPAQAMYYATKSISSTDARPVITIKNRCSGPCVTTRQATMMEVQFQIQWLSHEEGS